MEAAVEDEKVQEDEVEDEEVEEEGGGCQKPKNFCKLLFPQEITACHWNNRSKS